MENIIKQVSIANKNGAHYAALFLALSLPDICGALESANGEATKQKYIKWFNKYVYSKYNGNLDGETCYYFRCSILHQGSTIHNKNKYKRIIFLEPNDKYKFHNNIINDVLNLDVEIFCEDICEGVKEWLKNHENNKIVRDNMKKIIKRYPNGISPYIVGIPVIG